MVRASIDILLVGNKRTHPVIEAGQLPNALVSVCIPNLQQKDDACQAVFMNKKENNKTPSRERERERERKSGFVLCMRIPTQRTSE